MQPTLEKSKNTPERPKVALIDADYLVYSVAFASENDDEQWACRRINEWVTDIWFQDLKCDTFKGWITGSNNYRKEIAVTQPYKGNRKDKPKPRHYNALREYIQRLGIEVTEGQEADDAVAIAASTEGGWIVSNDKDLDQVPGWHWNPQKCIEYYVTPEEGLRNFYIQLLTGDDTDAIKGLWRIGEKKAGDILKDCESEIEMYAACVAAYEANFKKHPDKFPGQDPMQRIKENGALLWLRREPGQVWSPPV